MGVNLKYDPASKAVTVVLEFEADEQVSKDGLEPGVIENHLLGQAAELCIAAGNARLQGATQAQLEAAAVEAKAQIDAELAKKLAAVEIVSDVESNIVPK